MSVAPLKSGSASYPTRVERQESADLRPSKLFEMIADSTPRKPHPLSNRFSDSSGRYDTESWNRTESDETSTLDIKDPGHEFSIPDSGALAAVNYINPHTAAMQQKDIKQIFSVLPRYQNLIREFFPNSTKSALNHEQLAKLQALTKEVSSSIDQLLLDANAQREEKDFLLQNKGREILFLSRVLSRYRKLLLKA